MRHRRFSPLILAAVAVSFAGCSSNAADDARVAANDGLAGADIDWSLPDVDAQDYNIALRFDASTGEMASTVTGKYVATRDLDELTLDFKLDQPIDHVVIGGAAVQHRRDGKGHLILPLPRPAKRGESFVARIQYHEGEPAEPTTQRGLDWSSNRVATYNWPNKASTWLPLRDHPRDGATVGFELTFPKDFSVLANGTRIAERENLDGTKTTRYRVEQPMPTYGIFVSAQSASRDDWISRQLVTSSGLAITTYQPRREYELGTQFFGWTTAESQWPITYGDLGKVFDFYESLAGRYRWGSLSIVEDSPFVGMENPTMISIPNRVGIEMVAHEVAHHWAGNLVRIASWNDLWLSEGLAEYLEARAMSHLRSDAGRAAYRGNLTRGTNRDYGQRALRPDLPQVDETGRADELLDGITYGKGATVLRMIEHIVGEPKMAAFLKGWFERHAFRAVTTDDFERELTSATGVDLSKIFSGFVRSVSYPRLHVTQKPVGADTEITVEQTQPLGPEGGFSFPLDIDMVDAAGATERVTIDLTGKTTTKRVRAARTPVSFVVDPAETIFGVVTCGGDAAAACRPGYQCKTVTGIRTADDFKACMP